jgi:predicted DNA repair protein MutK
MWFAASTDLMACLLNIDGDKLVKKKAWILVAVAIVIAIAWWGSVQLKIDSCLDSGGRWSYELDICER